jgi:quinol monooxygenase YgiN
MTIESGAVVWKIIPTVLQEAGCHGYAPMVDHAAGVSFQTTAPDSIGLQDTDGGLQHIAFDRFRPGFHVRGLQVRFKMRDAFPAVLDQFAKIIPTVLQEAGCHGYAPMVDHAAGVSSAITVNMVNSTPSVWILSYSRFQ